MTEQHTCVVGYDQEFDYTRELYEGDEIPAGATVWNYCPECGRRHGAADKAAEAWERLDASFGTASRAYISTDSAAGFLVAELERLDVGFSPRK